MIQRGNNHKQKPKPTILVVDDSENVAKTLAMVLEHPGYNAVTAHSSRQALDLIVGIRVDLAAIDVNLPDADGVRTAVAVCNRLPHCKILLISGDQGTGEVLERALEQGIDFPILAKPIPPEVLLSTIRDLLKGKAART